MTNPIEGESTVLAGVRVVVIEDEGMTQWQLRRVLTRAGMAHVGSAPDGQRGVALVTAERPELVLLDVDMPIMNGLEAARQIRALYHPCIVLLTAFGASELREEMTALGICGYIVKPVTAEALIPQLETYLRDYRA
jgi:response regulator NasT